MVMFMNAVQLAVLVLAVVLAISPPSHCRGVSKWLCGA